MAIYTVQRLESRADADLPAGTILIKEGFCWPALFVPSLWAIAHRLWLVLALMVLALLALLAGAGSLPGFAALALYLLGRVYLAVEANGLRRWTLFRKGYDLVGVVEGRSLEEAERRYFGTLSPSDGHVAERPAVTGPLATPDEGLTGPTTTAVNP